MRPVVIGQLDWNTYWRWERFRRRVDPLDFRRWKGDSQRGLRRLHPEDGVKLLDSTAGMGDHAVNLAEAGFDVEALDVSPVAREATAERAREAGLELPIHDVRWEDLGETHPERFDLVFNDALHWTEDPAALRESLEGFLATLKPGGALVFFFADAREPEPGAGMRLLEWDWDHMERDRVAWHAARDDTAVTLTIHAERGEDHLDEHHVYLIEEGDERRTESLTMRRIYRWDWAAMNELLRDVGFVDVKSDVFENEMKGYTFALNRAFKAQ